MNLKELDRLAKEKTPMPAKLTMYEQAYYIASRGLYEQYNSGLITLEDAKKEKQQVITLYHEGMAQWQLFKGLFEIEDKLKKLKEEGFDSALEIEILELIEVLLK